MARDKSRLPFEVARDQEKQNEKPKEARKESKCL